MGGRALRRTAPRAPPVGRAEAERWTLSGARSAKGDVVAPPPVVGPAVSAARRASFGRSYCSRGATIAWIDMGSFISLTLGHGAGRTRFRARTLSVPWCAAALRSRGRSSSYPWPRSLRRCAVFMSCVTLATTSSPVFAFFASTVLVNSTGITLPGAILGGLCSPGLSRLRCVCWPCGDCAGVGARARIGVGRLRDGGVRCLIAIAQASATKNAAAFTIAVIRYVFMVCTSLRFELAKSRNCPES